MIPEFVLQFLREKGNVAVGGTRNAQLVPHVHFVSGWAVEDDNQTIRCSIPQAFTENLLESLEDNGQFCLTIEQVGTHETYQFKGTYSGTALLEARDMAAYERVKAELAGLLKRFFGCTDVSCQSFTLPPKLVVKLKVREIFVQTPGPEAGRRIVPPEEARSK